MQEKAREKIKKLVDKFNSLPEVERNRYNEEQTKNYFIRPLFEALGWDFSNSAEVSMEETIVGKRADYEFKLNGIPKFYTEAKPIRADLDSEQYARQAINYAWNKSVSWAVLTDFESIKIFNALANSKLLSDKLVFEIPVAEYERDFDRLWLLSKESFSINALDTYAEKYGKKIKKLTVNEKLFGDLKEAREILMASFKIWNEKVGAETLEEGVQRILDRLVFIRVLEDRGLEQNILKQVVREREARGTNAQLFPLLLEKFKDLDEHYDSSIFKKHACDDWEENDDKLKKVILTLYGNEMYEYNFKEIPADILGGVYESYLGYIAQKPIEADKSGKSGRLFKVEDKKEVKAKSRQKRKEQGIYYTPKFIVDYIVKNSLGEKLKQIKTIGELKKLKVLDPACGSGSFLTAALSMINEKYKEFGAPGDQGTKTSILLENIYGVDLDSQAVELAKLNLLIGALDKKAKLPDLTNNIRVGNSLISGTDEELEKLFGKNYRDKKPFNWQEEFSEVFKQGGFDVIVGNPPYIKEDTNKEAFDDLRHSQYYQGKMDIWTMFGCVAIDLLKIAGLLGYIAPSNWISNYGASIFRDKILKDGELKVFIDFGDYKVFEQAGIQTMVFVFEKRKPNKKYEVEYFRVLDKNIDEGKLSANIFGKKQKIEIEPQKLIGKNITFLSTESDPILNKIIKKGEYYFQDEDLTQGIVPNPDVVNSRNITKLADDDIKKFNIKINDGVFVIPKDFLKISNSEKGYIKPLFDTDQIGRYKFDKNNQKELIYIPKNEKISENSTLLQHLNKYRPIMEERRENLSGSIKYYNLHWPRNLKYFEKGPKIISVRKCKVPTFSYTEDECYVMLTFNVIKTDKVNLKYLVGLLNSKLIYFWLKQKGKLQGDMFQIDTEPLQQIPIFIGDEKQQRQIVPWVDKMFILNQELRESSENSDQWQKIKDEIAKTDKKIDKAVYRLYGLTEEEIKIVEGKEKE